MSGPDLLIDTNIVLYVLSGDEVLAEAIESNRIHISVITRMEVLSGFEMSEEELLSVKAFFEGCTIIPLNSNIQNAAVALRRKTRMKLPDAIIAASAMVGNMPLLSADKGFGKLETQGLRLIQYQP